MRKGMIGLAAGVAGAVGALAVREAVQRQADARHFAQGREFWRHSFPPEYVQWALAHLDTYHIPSHDHGVHLDVYAQPQRSAPTVIIMHGLMTYGRLFLPMIQLFYERGYTVVCPDLIGNGFSGGIRGDSPVPAATDALVDATLWVRTRFDGPIFLMGISLGSVIVYAAAAQGAPVAALSCLDLFAFGDREALRQNLATPQLISLLPLLRALAVPFGWVRLPTQIVSAMGALVSPDETQFIAHWFRDPLLPRSMTLRTLVSAGYAAPAVPLEANTIPTLVINQERDQVLNPDVTRASFDRLGGAKRYVEIAGSPHWSFKPAFQERLVAESDQWFRMHSAFTASAQPTLQGTNAGE
jgi:pimeloyl-ACP methyl ester carboxylesterase